MASCFVCSRFTLSGGVISLPTSRGVFGVNHLVSLATQLLPTDSIGYFALTLTNVIPGSRVHVQDENALTLYDSVSPTYPISIPVYQAGSVKNNLTIKVRNASSSPTYKPYQTQSVASLGSQSIYISQILDE